MLTVHHLNNSRSQRILWLCEELDLDYAVVKHQRHPETQRSPESLCSVHPLGKSPVADHDGLVIAETEAIMEYICHTLADGRLSRSPGSKDYAAYLQWLAFSEGTVFPGLVLDLVYAWTAGGNEALKSFFDVELEKNLKYVESSLGDREYLLASGFSGADINLGWTFEFAECRGRLRPYPGLQAYVERLRARPGYKRALERGGPQDLSVFSAGVS